MLSFLGQESSLTQSSDMSTEMYTIRLVIAAILVLMGGFFAGNLCYQF
jgi:hypothetical protein